MTPDTDLPAGALAEQEPIVFDVAGQPGGPSPEEQARVDAEQRETMTRIRAEAEAGAEQERAAGNDAPSKIARAGSVNLAAILQRLDAVEAKVNG